MALINASAAGAYSATLAAQHSKARDEESLDAVLRDSGRTGTFLAAVVSTAPVVPTLAAVAVALAYGMAPTWLHVIPLAYDYPVLSGTLLVACAWLIYTCGLWVSGRTAAAGANVHEFNLLYSRARTLAVRLKDLAEVSPALTGQGDACAEHRCARIAYDEAVAACETIAGELRRRGPNWVQATGYVNLWTLIHEAEQSLIEIAPREALVRDAAYDQLRLKGSTIDNRDAWLLRLERAIAIISASAHNYIDSSSSQASAHISGGCAFRVAAGPPNGRHASVPSQPTDAYAEAEARAILRDVRRAIDNFRDDRRDKLVRACNHLKAAIFATGLAAYTLLAAVIGFDGPASGLKVHAALQQGVRAVVVLFLVGVIVGYFGRLNVDTGADAAAEDYGLSATRLRQVPVFSGLAAVGGVLVAAVLQAGTAPPLVTVYGALDVRTLITAAIFGLAPGLLIDRLQQKTTEQYKRDLKGTEPTPSVTSN